MSTIRAGWSIQVRATGLQIAEPLAFEVTLPLGGAEYRLTIEVAETPATPVFGFEVPMYAVHGHDIQARVSGPPGESKGDQPGAWIVVFATRDMEVDEATAANFQRDPDTGLDPVRAALAEDVTRESRPLADICAGVVALSLLGTRPARWRESAVYWHNETQYKTTASSPTIERLAPSSYGKTRFLLLASSTAAVAGAPKRTRTIIALCMRCLIVAHGLPLGSNERFVTIFQCLEALCSVASSAPTEVDAAGFALMESACAKLDNPAAVEANAFLQAVRERLAKPSLRTRFGRLSGMYGGDQAAEHERLFDAVRGARNDLLHARVAEIPAVIDGVGVHEAAYELATFYLAAVVDRIRDTNPPKMTWTRGFDDDPV